MGTDSINFLYMKKCLITLIALLTPLVVNADAVEINGIYYNLIKKVKTAEVTYNPNVNYYYNGDIIIPSKVIFEDLEYNVTSIGEHAFNGCEITSITIPNSITSIGEYAFSLCRTIESISIPNSVTSIGAGAFQECYHLVSINIPNGISVLNSHTFASCTSLTSITIPNSVTEIGQSSFYKCGLISITIPNEVENIWSNAFASCSNLTSVNICNSAPSLQNEISTRIYQEVFNDCTNLTTVTIGRNVSMIFGNAFANCPNLEKVYCLGENAPYANSDAFENSYIDYATLYVPAGSIGSYQTTEPWSNFNRIIDYDEVSLTSNNIRTFSSVFDLDLSGVTGLSAYAISDYSAGEGTLTLTPVSQAKAGEGLLIKGDAGEYTIPHTTTDATYTNYLVGVPTTTSVSPTDGDYTNFVLANGTHGVNFYALSKTGNISAGKAYLRLPTADINKSNLSRGFVIDNNGTTLISTPIRNEYDDMLYDLQGRRVNKPSKGLYIVNGKKVIIK